MRINLGYESGYEFYRAWSGDDFPRLIAVTLINPTPYYDFSAAMNSDNNGPYDDAIMQELIPYIEAHFRIIPASYARVLVGKSSGGRDALGLQLHHPDFFGGVWVFYPWGINYSNYFDLNIYKAKNAFTLDWNETQGLVNEAGPPIPRYFVRTTTGKPVITWHDWVYAEYVSAGNPGVGAEFTGSDNALNSPVGPDGYPVPLFNKQTGEIDPTIAAYWHKHDLTYLLETNWPSLGPKLVGKLHFYTGDMDEWHRNFGVHDLEDFLKNTTTPYYAGTFTYTPLKGHASQPMTNAELVKTIAAYIAHNAPPGTKID
jgi:Putative esterase